MSRSVVSDLVEASVELRDFIDDLHHYDNGVDKLLESDEYDWFCDCLTCCEEELDEV